MQIKLIAFGIARDILGNRENTFEWNKEPTIGLLKDWLVENYPALSDLRHFHLAINESYAAEEDVFSGTDEIVLIPPVSGG